MTTTTRGEYARVSSRALDLITKVTRCSTTTLDGIKSCPLGVAAAETSRSSAAINAPFRHRDDFDAVSPAGESSIRLYARPLCEIVEKTTLWRVFASRARTFCTSNTHLYRLYSPIAWWPSARVSFMNLSRVSVSMAQLSIRIGPWNSSHLKFAIAIQLLRSAVPMTRWFENNRQERRRKACTEDRMERIERE